MPRPSTFVPPQDQVQSKACAPPAGNAPISVASPATVAAAPAPATPPPVGLRPGDGTTVDLAPDQTLRRRRAARAGASGPAPPRRTAGYGRAGIRQRGAAC